MATAAATTADADRDSKALFTVSNDGHSQIFTKAEAKNLGVGHLYFSRTTIDCPWL